MNISDLRTKVFEEVQKVPEDKLTELYNLIHFFRLHLPVVSDTPVSIMQFAGCWSDFPDNVYTEFLNDIAQRRQQAFSERRNHEASSC